jgi:hypothetical protein
MQIWEKYKKFRDEIGTIFEKVDSPSYDYRFTTVHGDSDFCTIGQMVHWDITVVEVIEE